MVELIEICDASAPELAELTALYERAFPEEERRLTPDLLSMIGSVEAMHLNKIMYDGSLAGMLIFWRLGDFSYIEHFAVFEHLRGSGIGAAAVKRAREILGDDVILEAELPTDNFSRRRIGFYSRCGFEPVIKDYVQPDYRSLDDACPLWILSCTTAPEPAVRRWTETLKNKVYRDFVLNH